MRKRRYKINEEYFNTWSHNMAYLLGFIVADGNVYKSTLSIALNQKDESILDLFTKELGASKKHSRVLPTGVSKRVRFNSVKLVNSLACFGIIPNKSSSIRIQHPIPKEYIGDYIRGVFDGDGWVYCRRNSIESGIVSASKGFLEDLLKLTTLKGKVRVRRKRGSKNDYYVLDFFKKSTLELRDILYAQDDSYCLKRKRDIFFSDFYKKSDKFWSDKQIVLLIENFERPLKEMPEIVGKSYKAISKKKWELRKNADTRIL